LALVFGELPKWIARKVRRPDLKEKYEGLSVEQIAEREHKHLIDAMLDLTVEDDLHTEWAAPVINVRTELYSELLAPPYMIPGVSDGGAHIKFITPGIFPTEVLAWLSRDVGALSLEEAHFRLSGLPAWAAGFKDRGTLREGMAADVVVYDLNKLKALPEEILHDVPADEWRRVQKCEGYRWIMVNGQPIFEEGNCTGATPGRLLRGGRAVA
jgi:N-acyl-D-aspartate/D-glutamate deacylase